MSRDEDDRPAAFWLTISFLLMVLIVAVSLNASKKPAPRAFSYGQKVRFKANGAIGIIRRYGSDYEYSVSYMDDLGERHIETFDEVELEAAP